MAIYKINSLCLNSNYVDPGDILYITTTWEKTSENNEHCRIAADIVFCGRHRREENQAREYRTVWDPYPRMDMWLNGDVRTTTGFWTVPDIWGGSYEIRISLISDDGEALPFIGKDGTEVYCEAITEFDVGWGWGRESLKKQRRPIFVELNKPVGNIAKINKSAYKLGEFYLNKEYPSVIGYGANRWEDWTPIVTERNISENRLIRYNDRNIFRGFRELKENNAVLYSVSAEHISFDMEFKLCDKFLSILPKNIEEKDGYEFIAIEIPSVIQSKENDCLITNHFSGGRAVELNKTLQQSFRFEYDTCNAPALISKSDSFCVFANDLDTVLYESVTKKNKGTNIAVISAEIHNRISANKKGLCSVPVDVKPLEVYYSKNAPIDFSSEIVRNKAEGAIKTTYTNTIVYKLTLDNTAQYNENYPDRILTLNSLQDVENFIKKVYNLSGGLKQVIYLVGWQYGGHDFQYPYTHKAPFNPKCGTIEEFNDVRKRVKEKYNAILSFHDNFDDAYFSFDYKMNEDVLAVDEKGEKWRGWLWAGGMSYIINPVAYLKSADFKERVNDTIRMYGIEESYHLDVLTSEMHRISFDKENISSSENGIEAKIEIIEEFNKLGIDLTSEKITLPFVNKIGFAQGTRYKFKGGLFSGDYIIPLTTSAFHGFAPYTMGQVDDKSSILRAIACGVSYAMPSDAKCNTNEIIRNLLFVTLPMMKLAYKKVTNTEISENEWNIFYENDSRICVNWKDNSYSIVFEGNCIAENFVSKVPIDNKKIMCGAFDGGKISLCVSKNFKNALVYKIDGDGNRSESENIDVNNGRADFYAEPDNIYIVEMQ